MKTLALSYENKNLCLIYLILFCFLHITTATISYNKPIYEILQLLDPKLNYPASTQQVTATPCLDLFICTESSLNAVVEGTNATLLESLLKIGYFLKSSNIHSLDAIMGIQDTSINKDKTCYLLERQEGNFEGSKEINSGKVEKTSLRILELILEALKRENRRLILSYRSNLADSSFEELFISVLPYDIQDQDQDYTEKNKYNRKDNRKMLDLEDLNMSEAELVSEMGNSDNNLNNSITIKQEVKTDLASRPLRNLRSLDETSNHNTNSDSITTWIIIVIIVVVILLGGTVLALIAYLKRRRNKNMQQNPSSQQTQAVPQTSPRAVPANHRATTAEEATRPPHSPPVVRTQQEYMNSDEDLNGSMHEDVPCFNSPVKVEDVIRLFEIHFEGYKDSKIGEGHQCVICFDAKKTIMFSPCTHICACEPCAQEIRTAFGKCPLCRTPIEDLTYIVKSGTQAV